MVPLVKLVIVGMGMAGLLTGVAAMSRSMRPVLMGLALAGILGSVFAFSRAQLVPYHADAEQRCALLTGDEPDYLLTSVSMARDGDINIANNIARSDYLLYQSRPVGGGDFDFFNRISKGRISAHRLEWGEARYMQHRPGISAFLAPVFKLAGGDYRWWAYVMVSCVVMAFAVLAFTVGVRLGPGKGIVAIACLGTTLAPPALFYANQVYPEAVAGCLLAVAALGCMGGGRWVWGAVGALLAVVWFSDRALPAFGILAVLAVMRLPSAGSRLLAVVVLLADGMLFGAYCQHRFGIPLPISHNEVFDCSVALIPRRMVQILFDGMQGWGWLFPPILLIPALAWSLIRQRPAPVIPLLILCAVLLSLAMVASFGDWRGGTNPRGRYYVIPQLLLLPLWFYWFRTGVGGVVRVRAICFVGLLTLALIPVPWLVGHPSWWYRPYHPFFGWDPIQRYYVMIPQLPDDSSWGEWLKLLLWMPLLALPSLACIRAERQSSRPAFPDV